MDLRLNATRRSINLPVYLVFDLEARRFKFLGENLLGARAVENEPSTPDSFSYKRVDFTVNAKPTLLLFLVLFTLYSSPSTGILRTHEVASSQGLDSSAGRALHRYRRGHEFESRSGLNFFQ